MNGEVRIFIELNDAHEGHYDSYTFYNGYDINNYCANRQETQLQLWEKFFKDELWRRCGDHLMMYPALRIWYYLEDERKYWTQNKDYDGAIFIPTNSITSINIRETQLDDSCRKRKDPSLLEYSDSVYTVF